MKKEDDAQLTDENVYPDEDILKEVLSCSYDAYRELLHIFSDNQLVPEWRYYRDGKSWLCKVQRKKKTIAWITVWPGYFKAVIYLAERFLPEIVSLPISAQAKESIVAEKNIGKIKPCIFEMRDKSAIGDFETVMQFKIKAR